MEKKKYNSPSMTQIEFVSESCLASSTTETSEVTGINPEPWKEGNVNWW